MNKSNFLIGANLEDEEGDNMALKFKNRAKEHNLKKVLVYGMDGSGKSTFAEQYCKEHNLKPVCIDIDDTNYTNVPIVEINLTTDLTTYNSIKETIKDITKTKEFDTIILDGVTSLLELLTSKAKGMAAYSDRSKRWNDILRALLISRKNIIFVGQIDMELIFTPDAQSSKAVIKVNSMVNEKYYCYIDEKGQYLHDVKKFRTLEQIEAEAKPKAKAKPKPKEPAMFESSKEIAESIVAELPQRNMLMAKLKLKELVDTRVLNNDECPAILAEIEKVLA